MIDLLHIARWEEIHVYGVGCIWQTINYGGKT